MVAIVNCKNKSDPIKNVGSSLIVTGLLVSDIHV